MPFDEGFNDIYQLGIKAACKDAGGYCERVDEQIFHESILERVYNQIAKADLIIADMTGRNPNVFYEVGYAHALGQRVILLTQKSDDIPFDLKHYPHIVYGGKIAELKGDLEKRVRWAFENPKNFKKASQEQIQIFYRGQRIIDSPEITIDARTSGVVALNMPFDIHNSTEKTIEVTEFQVGFIADSKIGLHQANNGRSTQQSYQTRSVSLPNDLTIHIVDNVFQILPGSWEKLGFYFIDQQNLFRQKEIVQFTIRLFTVAGTLDFSFRLKAIFK